MYRSLVSLSAFLLLAGCMEGSKPTPLSRGGSAAAKQTLYDRMGGEAVIAKVVDDLVANVIANDKIKEAHKRHFQEGDVAGLKRKLIDQIGEATGGPQKYMGKNMKEAHQGLGITEDDFNALAADLIKAMDKNGVGKTEQNELLRMFAAMKPDVVEKLD